MFLFRYKDTKAVHIQQEKNFLFVCLERSDIAENLILEEPDLYQTVKALLGSVWEHLLQVKKAENRLFAETFLIMEFILQPH